MSWTKEQFAEFCQRAGVTVEQALATGRVDLGNPLKKVTTALPEAKKRPRKTRSDKKERPYGIKGLSAFKLRAAKLECHDEVALVTPEGREHQGPVRTDGRITVRITIARCKPCDPDNAIGGIKPLIDALRHSGLIPEDSNEAIRLEVEQVKAGKKAEENVSVTLQYPDLHPPST